MAHTTLNNNGDRVAQLRDEFNRLAASFDAGVPGSLAAAMERVFTALEYKDEALRQSAVVEAKAALAELVDEATEKRLAFSTELRKGFGSVAAEIGVWPSPDYDEIGRMVEGHINDLLRALTDLRDGAVRTLTTHGVELSKAAELDAEIERVMAFKQSLIGEWPWSHHPTPAVDEGMRARSREEFSRGGGIPLADLIRQIEAGE